MIKVLEGPRPVQCDTCGCTFTFEASDVKQDSVWTRGAFLGILPLSKSCKTVRCPVCDSPHIIEMY